MESSELHEKNCCSFPFSLLLFIFIVLWQIVYTFFFYCGTLHISVNESSFSSGEELTGIIIIRVKSRASSLQK